MSRSNQVALWAGITALTTNVAAINILALAGAETNEWAKVLAATITAIASAAAVYAKQRLDDEKAKRQHQEQQPHA